MLVGSAISGSVFFDAQDIGVDKRFLLTDTEDWYREGRDSVSNENFSLTT
jgi:hypothetical protein